MTPEPHMKRTHASLQTAGAPLVAYDHRLSIVELFHLLEVQETEGGAGNVNNIRVSV